jgi:hypothetical protein
VLTVKSDLDPHMINKLKDKCKSWVLWVWFEVYFELRGLVYTYT